MNGSKETFMSESMDIISAMDDLLLREDDRKWKSLAPRIVNNKDVQTEIEEYLAGYYWNHDACVARAYCFAFFLLIRPVAVTSDDGLLGSAIFNNRNRAYPRNRQGEMEELLETGILHVDEVVAFQEAREMWLFFRCPGGHTIPNYEMLLSCGYEEFVQKIRKLLKESAGCAEKADFYLAELVACRAAQYLILRYRDAAYDARECEGKGDMCNRISQAPPQSFKEAVQLLWFAHECVIAEGDLRGISLGRLDQILYPFYERDAKNGLIDKNEAIEIICQLWQKFAFQRDTSFNFQNVTLGGMDYRGNDESNELTLIMLEASFRLRQNQPMLSLRIGNNTPTAVWNKAYECIKTGMGVPALFHDDVVAESKEFVGIPKEDAYDYSIVGCVETSIGGREYSHTEGLRINWAKVLELMFFGGKCPVTGKDWTLHVRRKLAEISTFDMFLSWYKEELVNVIERGCHYITEADKIWGEKHPMPYLSLLMSGCLERGRDVTRGGGIYNNLCVNFAGMANVVNALIAVKYAVFQDKIIELVEIPAVLKNDFSDHEELRKYIMGLPKYGNGIEEPDVLMKVLVELAIETVNKYRCARGGKLMCGFYTVWLHSIMGENMVASFDGRRSGTSLASSLSPAQGTDVSGPLAVFQSITQLPLGHMANGMVLDIKFLRGFFESMGQERFSNLVNGYFRLGGQELQINVVERETLLEAQKHPEEYQNLMVRVSGFSTYFVLLNKTLQDEIIMRYENATI